MSEPVETAFSSRAELEEHWFACIGRANALLQMFDPDFAVWPLGSSQADTALRAFLRRGGVIEVAAHRTALIERQYPRFLTLLKDYGHRISCRVTPRSLHGLTDSFCIADGVHIVRRFHSATCAVPLLSICHRQAKSVENALPASGRNRSLAFTLRLQACSKRNCYLMEVRVVTL